MPTATVNTRWVQITRLEVGQVVRWLVRTTGVRYIGTVARVRPIDGSLTHHAVVVITDRGRIGRVLPADHCMEVIDP